MSELTEEELDKREAARAERLGNAAKTRRLKDRAAILDVEETLGNVPLTRIEVPFVADDLPVLVAVRPPEEVELKRYRTGLKRDAQGQLQDATAITNQIGRTCCVYPEPEVLKRLVTHFTTLDTQLGQETLALSRGKVHAEGKG